MANGKWRDVVANGDSKTELIITGSMPVACSEDLQRHIVWQSIYKEANPDKMAVSLYVCEGTIRRMVGHFSNGGRYKQGRLRALTSLEETLILNVYLKI